MCSPLHPSARARCPRPPPLLVQLGLADHPACSPATAAGPPRRPCQSGGVSASGGLGAAARAARTSEPAFYNPDAPLAGPAARPARADLRGRASPEESSARTAEFFAGRRRRIGTTPGRRSTPTANCGRICSKICLKSRRTPRVSAPRCGSASRARRRRCTPTRSTILLAAARHQDAMAAAPRRPHRLRLPAAAPAEHFARAFPADPAAVNRDVRGGRAGRRAFVVTLSEASGCTCRRLLPPRCDSAAISLNLWVPSGAMRTLAEADAAAPLWEKWGTESRAAALAVPGAAPRAHQKEDPPTAAGAEPSCCGGRATHPPSRSCAAGGRRPTMLPPTGRSRPRGGKVLAAVDAGTLLDKFDAYARKRAAVRAHRAGGGARHPARRLDGADRWLGDGRAGAVARLLERLRACAAEVGLD